MEARPCSEGALPREDVIHFLGYGQGSPMGGPDPAPGVGLGPWLGAPCSVFNGLKEFSQAGTGELMAGRGN